jgi:hypothetical protein
LFTIQLLHGVTRQNADATFSQKRAKHEQILKPLSSDNQDNQNPYHFDYIFTPVPE